MAKRETGGGDRDLRLDFFRGLALWFIFVDHIPANQFAWATLRNYGLSDATEIFVFISGFTATLVYSRVMAEHGIAFAAAKVLHRCWTLYITYMFLFFAFTAQVAYTARVFDNPLFREEMGIAGYFEDPALALVHALILMFRPANLDVLPLYIVLLLSFPLVLPALVSRPRLALAGSALLYLLTRRYQWNLPTYPEGGVWYFNPFAWQFLFVLGGVVQRFRHFGGELKSSRFLLAASICYLLVSLVLALSWRIAWLGALMPPVIGEWLYPISKTDLDPLRVLHFAALAHVTLHFVGRDAAWLRWRLAEPLVTCGRQSLQIFCLGIILSFAGQTVLVQFNDSLLAQFATTVVGIAAMVVVARILSWYQKTERRPKRTTPVRDTGA
ncbi:OpgC protein [Skermanella stibiiresistens SB22]|uniref:OpgC protein n=1 Tax=Skermanella stibiiresistens SB22 TaxID=1385369 RepID=W9GZ56_9PROT|nr:OpgC domain-containing protein [Skermanella stibiiresistens]EWY39099.1 OpgC protein [Skermanella stibiiresistens SB22]